MPCEKRSLFHRGEMLSLFHCGAFHCGKVPLGLVPQDESGVCYLENRESPKIDCLDLYPIYRMSFEE